MSPRSDNYFVVQDKSNLLFTKNLPLEYICIRYHYYFCGFVHSNITKITKVLYSPGQK
jgi:hypothetical protein